MRDRTSPFSSTLLPLFTFPTALYSNDTLNFCSVPDPANALLSIAKVTFILVIVQQYAQVKVVNQHEYVETCSGG